MLPFSLTFWHFAAAGAVCALGPVIIHLLNRRRYRVVKWGAMDFLKEAVQRNRRILHLRDLLLLALRTLAILLFGLALARPFWASSQAQFDSRQPLHAVVVIDNSLSMGYRVLGGDLLAQAKARAKEFVDELPAGSKVSILPACGQSAGVSLDPYDTKEAAREALDKVKVVDRSASFVRGLNEAKKACDAVPQLGKRIVFFTDAQRGNWRDLQTEELQGLPPVQVVDVASEGTDNAWISDLALQDELADVETPSTILVEVQQRGKRSGPVQVTLSLGDAVIGERTIDFSTGEDSGAAPRQVEFQHTFNTLAELPEPDRPVFAALKASITADNLPYDDSRYLMVPVVAALPVVFVDQYGDQEDATRNKLGETRHLRKLLAPKTARGDAPKQLVKVRHLRPDQLSRDVLSDARMVVVAGVPAPGENVALLREYVQQGGQLLLAAGAGFDPEAWTNEAWLDGAGILPLPLAREPLGDTPEVAGDKLKPFFLSFESMQGDTLFKLRNVGDDELRDLYSEPFFFKAVKAELTAETLEKAAAAQTPRLIEELEFLAAAAGRKAVADSKRGELSEAERSQMQDDEIRLKALRPTWLTWAANLAQAEEAASASSEEREKQVAYKLQSEAPRILARFTNENGPAFLAEKKLGRGRVFFCSTGLQSAWNTLPQSNAIFVFDRLLRGAIRATLSERNFTARERLTLPLASADRDIVVTLTRPGKESQPETLDAGFIGAELRGVTLTGLDQRGIYRIAARRNADEATAENRTPASEEKPLWEVSLAVNGEAAESDLTLTRAKFDELTAGAPLRWVGPHESISLAGEAFYGQSTWWWLAATVLALLLLEMSILAWPRFSEPLLAPVA